MDPTLLTTLISLAVSVVTTLTHRYLVTPATPSKPAAPTVDPYAGQPGLPGHPLRNLIDSWLQGQIGGQLNLPLALPQMPAATSSQGSAAVAAIAAIIKNDPALTQMMLSQLGAPAKA